MRTPLCSIAIAIASALGGGCSRDKAAPPAPVGSGSTAVAPAPTPAAGVEIFVNDMSVGVVQPSLLSGWPRLDSLVPGDARKLGTWETVSLQAAPAPTELRRPSSAYPDMVPAIFPGPGGAPAFGMFDPVELAKKGTPAMHADHVTAIRIKIAQGGKRGQNDDGGGGGTGDPTGLVVTVKTPSGMTSLSGEKILALPREPMPGNPDQKGWRLTALLEAAGVKSYEHLVLSDASGTNLTLDKADVSDASVPFIKLNKQGALRLRVLKKAGDGWNPGGDLRALVGIEAK